MLLVDGDPDMRLYLRLCVRSVTPPPIAIFEVADAIDALRLVRTGDVDLVIASLTLAGMDGHRLRQTIRDDARLGHVAVLLFDVHAPFEEHRPDGLLAGPLNGRRLAAALADLPAPRTP